MASPQMASSRKPKRPATPVSDPHASVVVDRTAPRHEYAWAALCFALCTLALAFPALTGGFLINPNSDQFIGGFPVRDFAAMSLKAGHGIPLWNPYLFGGLPYVAAMHGDIFYPTFLLRALLPTDVAMTWSFIIHIFLAGFFTYGFLRAWGLGFLPSLIGGVAYMMGGPIAAYVSPGHDGKLYIGALFPLALWLILFGIRDGRSWAWGALSLVIGLAVLSPHPQLLQYMLLGCGAFSLYIAFAGAQTPNGDIVRLERSVALKRLGLALGAVVLGGLMGAIQYLPVREYVPFSPRGGGREYEFATQYSFPIEELFNTYLPQFSGILNSYWGRNNIHLHSEYLGAAALVLAGAGLRSERRGFRWFWIGTLIVSTLWALGQYTPFYRLIYAVVPGTPYFRAPSTMIFIAAFAVAVLAALGTERFLAGKVSRTYALGWLGFGLAVALLASVGGLTNMSKVIANSWAGEYQMSLIDMDRGALVAGAWRSFLAVALTVGVYLLYQRGQFTSRVLGWSLAALVALDLFSVEKQYWMFSPRASVLYASDPAIEYMKNQPEPGRVLAETLQNLPYRDIMLSGDGLMVHGIRQAFGYHGNELGRYQQLTQNYVKRFTPAFWRHQNVRYLYTSVDSQSLNKLLTPLGVPPLQPVMGPVKNAAGTTVYLYRLPGDNPLAWVAPVFIKAPSDAARAAVLDPGFDPTRVAVVDSEATIPTRQISTLPPSMNVPVKVTRYAPGDIQLELATSPPEGSALVVSENYFTGWNATVDGKAAPVARTDYNLIGIRLPAGARNVSLRYDDPAYQRGKVITIIAVLVGVLLAIGGLVIDRRARRA